ncbi:hypothetical protein APHAL10511_000903 [Amanita phalloides]|nr:hypothetical protein APHAL10511_000903 [Amanita phalloides]
MDAALLVKIPCLLLVTYCLQISFTAPTPRATVHDGAVIKSSCERMLRFVTASICHWRRSLWIAAAAEILVIVAKSVPELPLSDAILSTLLIGQEEHRIRLTGAAVMAVPLGIIGAAIRAWCYRELGKHFTYELTIRKDHNLITTGPYSVVRHPSYTGVIVNMFVIYLLHGTKGSWVRESGLMANLLGNVVVYGFAAYTVMFFVGLMKRTKEEDRELRSRFGKEWEDWAARVPYSLVPGII